MLEAAHLAADTGTPILGINIGNVGYLAEVEVQNWEQALRRVLVGSYEIENRMMLDGFVTDSNRYPYPGAFGHALNDIVITRSRGLQVLDFNVCRRTILNPTAPTNHHCNRHRINRLQHVGGRPSWNQRR